MMKEIYNPLTKTRRECYRRMRAASITVHLVQQINHRDISSEQLVHSLNHQDFWGSLTMHIS